MSPEVINGLFGIGGTIIGAVLAGLFSWHQHKKTKTRTELTVLCGRPATLIAVDSSIENLVKITVANNPVSTVHTFDISVMNTGTETVKPIHIPIDVKLDGYIFGADVVNKSFSVLNDAIEIKIDGDSKVDINVDYLNAGDSFIVKVLLTAEPDEISAHFRQEGVKSTIKTDYDPVYPGVMGRTLYEAIRRDRLMHFMMKLSLPQYRKYIEATEDNDGK